MEANSTGGQGSRRAVAPNDDDDDDDDDDDEDCVSAIHIYHNTCLNVRQCYIRRPCVGFAL